MKRLLIVVLLAVFVGGFSIWWFSPTQVVKRKTEKLLSTLTFDETKSGVGRKNLQFKGLLAKNVELNIPLDNIPLPVEVEFPASYNREELAAGHAILCREVKKSSCKAEKIDSIAILNDVATVKFLMSAQLSGKEFQPLDKQFDVMFVWKKDPDNGWQLTETTAKAK